MGLEGRVLWPKSLCPPQLYVGIVIPKVVALLNSLSPREKQFRVEKPRRHLNQVTEVNIHL